jgi:D-serine deaminase-like pyridoxal phosphate-dependent protein
MNVIPNHVCVVVNMFDRIVLTRDFEIIGDTPIEARGKII